MAIDSDTAHVATRLLMAGSFAVAATATAARRRWGYTFFFVLAVGETFARLRYPVLVAGRDWLLGSFPPNSRKYPLQIAMLALAVVIAGGALTALVAKWRRKPAELALRAGALGVAAVFVLETISFHYTDAIIYAVQGGVMRSGWMYAVPAWIAAAGALALRRR